MQIEETFSTWIRFWMVLKKSYQTTQIEATFPILNRL